jgi:transcriptional antiterminator RfaH
MYEKSMPTAWYAIHSQPHKEDLLANQLHAYGIEVFYPNLIVKPKNPRSKKNRPYFPGYMFVRSDLDAIGITTFQRMPYATGLVEFGGEPAVVPDILIAALQKHIRSNYYSDEDRLEFQSNDAVAIEDGAFQGYNAIFDKMITGSDRVRVLLKLLNNRLLPVELESKLIRKKSVRR